MTTNRHLTNCGLGKKWYHYIIFIFLLLVQMRAPAQDYRLFNSGQDYYYDSDNSSSFPSGPYVNYYSLSEVRVSHFDSVSGFAGDTLFYPFHTWRDTTEIGDTLMPCNIKEGPSWLGTGIQELANGITLLFDFEGDSIRIERLAGLGYSWILMRLPDGGIITATVDSLFAGTVAGITDSVKQIRLQALDSNSVILSAHPLNTKVIWLSRSNGLFRGCSFRELPQYAGLERREPVPMNTTGDLYNFDPGDEFEYITTCRDVFGHSQSAPTYTYIRILNKWYNAAQDTLYYSRERSVLGLTMNWNPTPHFDSTFSQITDTLYYTNLNTPVYEGVAEQNTTLRFTQGSLFGVYGLRKDSSVFHDRPVYYERTGFYDVFDSCIYFNDFEPLFYVSEAAPGLGVTYWSSDYRSQAGLYCEYSLFWYRKGNETFGNYISWFTGFERSISHDNFLLYPNPADKSCFLAFEANTFTKVELYTVRGELLKTWEVSGLSLTLGLEDISDGVYFIRARGANGSAVKRLIHFGN